MTDDIAKMWAEILGDGYYAYSTDRGFETWYVCGPADDKLGSPRDCFRAAFAKLSDERPK